MAYFPRWSLTRNRTVYPEQRLPTGASITMGIQHLFAMSGSTILGPLLMGFDPNLAILFSGIGTLLIFVCTGGRVPAYLGSSFSFIAVVLAVTGWKGSGVNVDIPLALGGIIAAGALYVIIGGIVSATGTGWIEKLMPPVVTGAVGTAIGLNLAPVSVQSAQGSGMHILVVMVTLLAVALISAYGPPSLRRISILAGIVTGYLCVIVLGNLAGLMPAIDFSALAEAPWFGMPVFVHPQFSTSAMVLIAPVAFILIAENLGHIKAISAMTGRDLDPYIARGFIGDGLATMVSAFNGGTGVTTYVENMGVMAVTRVFSTLVFLIAALFAIALGFSPKFGALLHTIPSPVLAGLAVAVFGLIAAAMIRLFVDNQVNFAEPKNLFTVGVTLVFGAGNFSVNIGSFAIGGIGTATLAAIIIYQLMSQGSGKASQENH